MIQKMYSMYDEKAEAFVRPFFMPNEALARRSIESSAKDLTHPFVLHPGDYILYELGTFDETTAEVHVMYPPKRIASVAEILPADDVKLMQTVPKGLNHGETPVSDEASVLNRAEGGNSA